MARKTFSSNTSQMPALRVTTLAEQYRRQRLSNNWRPAGLARFPYYEALQDEMPILGGIGDDQMGASPERFAPLDEEARRP